jgi:3-hydroxyisobutyrate dehydrogenase
MKIAILGAGLMGQAVTKRLLHFDYSVVVYNRTPEKARPLGDLGAGSGKHSGSGKG